MKINWVADIALFVIFTSMSFMPMQLCICCIGILVMSVAWSIEKDVRAIRRNLEDTKKEFEDETR